MVQNRSQRGSTYYISVDDKTCIVCFQHFEKSHQQTIHFDLLCYISDLSSKDRVIYYYRKFEQMRNHISEQKRIDNIPGKCTEEI